MSLGNPANGFSEYSNPLTWLQQKPEDREDQSSQNGIIAGWVDVVDALSLSLKRVYCSIDRKEEGKRGITSSSKCYSKHLEKLVDVCGNNDGPIYCTEEKDKFRFLSLQRGKRLCFYRNTLYASIFHGQVHALDLLSQKVTVYPLQANQRLLTALTYAHRDLTFDQAIWRAGFLLYDSATASLHVLAASLDSPKLKPVK